MTDATDNRVYTCPRCKEVIPSADWHDSILGGHTCDAIPNSADEKRLADFLRPALNEWEQNGQKYQRFSSGGEDTATAMARYLFRNGFTLGHATPNRVQPGTFGPVFDAGVEEGKRQTRHAIPNRVCTCVDAGYVIGSDPKCPRHATPNRVQRDVILQAILDEFALWNTPPKATVKMPNRGDASELANAIVRALERAT